ncbi:uncharacterized protein [Arachis hypogaea]|uniref:uncharacterized protein n=1 Tax=Arachis hypogaea TaxID=3818 RepID=UPI000DEC858B|nr:uncharacterized protein LOC112743157 [Arachis hypogaea]
MADAAILVKILQNAVSTKYGFNPIYRKVWMAKQKAIAQIYGDWEESYNLILRWIIGDQMYMPSIIAVLHTSPVRSVRWYFTHGDCTRWKLKHLPVAFVLVQGENTDSLKFFLHHLRQHVTLYPDILVISNCHNVIKAALVAEDSGWLPPTAYHTYCARHIAANFALNFKSKDARKILVNAAYAKSEQEHQYYMEILRSEDPAMVDWCNWIGLELLTQYRDGGRRYGNMTTNISQCIKTVLKGTLNLLVGSLVKSTYGCLAELERKGSGVAT